MIVIANPSGGAGRSFKGLHAYCAHDADQAETAERVEWISTRNVCADPEQAWKVMAATAYMADDLKREAGISAAGRPTTTGEVLHLVVSFADGEPIERETMEAAADELLSSLGADPAKMRGKSKPKRRQFADEHQAIMYAHTDTENTHLHIMVNTVHPETGLRLPTSNNFNKLQDWAGKFSERHGTAHLTPARAENREARENGEYVKGDKRLTRNMYELTKEVKSAVNDNDRAKAILDEQKAKDAALLQKGRDLADKQRSDRGDLDAQHKAGKAAIGKELRAKIGKAKAALRKKYRPEIRALKSRQAHEKKIFETMEKSFFGRTKNFMNAVGASSEDVREGATGRITRAFRILTNAGERKAYFERSQAMELGSLKSKRQAEENAETAVFKAESTDQLSELRESYAAKRDQMLKDHKAENDELKGSWKERTAEREEALEQAAHIEQTKPRIGGDFGRARLPGDYIKNLDEDLGMIQSFKDRASPASEQDNKRDKNRDDGQER